MPDEKKDKRKKAGGRRSGGRGEKAELIPSNLEPEGSSKEYRKNRARLIQKIYEVDPLTCPKWSGAMKVISVIEDNDVTRLHMHSIKFLPTSQK
ncbi:MAG: hypothetical protein PVG39_15395 [Desulfobacteraceae bacterium]